MFCWDGESCQMRYSSRKYFMSSTTWDSQMAQGGIFDPSPANSGFATANRIYVKYCSSDLWSGDVAASDSTPGGFAFRGARIVNAVIASLVADKGMGATPGQRLLFGGCSAGAIGAMSNLDSVAAKVPAGLQVQGFLDAAALVDIYPTGWDWSPDLIPLQTLVAELVSVISPLFPAACTAQYNGDNAWKCLWSSYRLPLVQTPYFANAVQFDDFEIQFETDNLGPSTPQQLAFVDSFQPAYLALIASLPAGTGVFSPTCLVHCLSGQSTFSSFLVNGQSLNDALSAWYFDATPTSVVSACQGWACTSQCGVTQQGLPCNMGSTSAGGTCQAVQLATSSPTEPAAATDNAVQELPGAVQDQEGSLSGAQQNALAATVSVASSSPTRKGLFTRKLMGAEQAATLSCCGGEQA
jgi:hypothetical protein